MLVPGTGLGPRGRVKGGTPMRAREAASDRAQSVKLVPPIEKVRLKTLTATDGQAHVGVELEYHTVGGEATRLQFGLCAEDAAALGAQLSQLAEKLCSTEH